MKSVASVAEIFFEKYLGFILELLYFYILKIVDRFFQLSIVLVNYERKIK